MGEREEQPFQLSFNWFLRVVFQGSRVTSNCYLVLLDRVREMNLQLEIPQFVHARSSIFLGSPLFCGTIAIVLLSLSACTSGETEAWQQATRLNTAAGYSDFLASHPGGPYVAEATIRYRSRLLADCRESKIIDACQTFIGRFPGDSETINLKANEIPDMLYTEAAKSHSLSSYRQYLTNSAPSHPKYQTVSKLVRELNRRDELTWREAQRKNSLESYQRYLDLNPEGAHRAEALTREDALRLPPAPDRPPSVEEMTRVPPGSETISPGTADGNCTPLLLEQCRRGPGGVYDPTNPMHRALLQACATNCKDELLGK